MRKSQYECKRRSIGRGSLFVLMFVLSLFGSAGLAGCSSGVASSTSAAKTPAGTHAVIATFTDNNTPQLHPSINLSLNIIANP